MKRKALASKNGLNLLVLSTTFLACTKPLPKLQDSVPILALSGKTAKAGAATYPATAAYQLIWADEFNGNGGFDSGNWQYSPRGTVAWNQYLTAQPAYASQDGNNLLLKMDNTFIADDPVPYHSGGVQSAGKFNLAYGKVEVRAKFTQGQGSWPAIWMMPEPATAHPGGWPGCGEIDIMEHVNNENVIHHTIHNSTVTNANGGSTATKAAPYTPTDYNTYAIEWDPASIRFYVNSTLQYTYVKVASGGWQQWPFDVPFYIILNQSGGAGWPGAITDANLPFSMQVDYVRVYKLSLMGNGDFEGTSITPWASWGGTVSVTMGNARSGSKAISESGGESSIEQVVTGLSANTTYTFGGYGKVSATGQTALIGVKDYGGNPVDYTVNSTTYALGTVSFTMGAANTSATLYFYKPTFGTVYGDDFYLEKR